MENSGAVEMKNKLIQLEKLVEQLGLTTADVLKVWGDDYNANTRKRKRTEDLQKKTNSTMIRLY